MKVALAYVFPNLQPETYVPLARRFVRSYQEHPPGTADHELHVFINGPSASAELLRNFGTLPVTFHQHDNSAKDLGAYRLAAATLDCDLLVCLGSPVHFRRSGWLDRMEAAYLQTGPGLYGCWGFAHPAPHIRTTAFWLPPEILKTYPHPVNDGTRYQFEHGRKESLLRWAVDSGFPAGVVTWSGTRLYPQFEHVPERECLMLDQHTDRHFK